MSPTTRIIIAFALGAVFAFALIGGVVTWFIWACSVEADSSVQGMHTHDEEKK